MKQHPFKCRLAQMALMSAILLSAGISPLAAGSADGESQKAVQRALPAGFPIPDNSRVLEKIDFIVKIGVEKATVASLAAFFEKELKKAGYRIIINQDIFKMASLGPDIDEGWTFVYYLPDSNTMQNLDITRSGDKLHFSAYARK